jgi:hypothetical protein
MKKPKSRALVLANARAVDKRQAPKKRKFLSEIAKFPNVTRAAGLAKIHKTVVYLWKRHDPSFARAWDEALQVGVGVLEDRAFDIALKGDPDSNSTARLIEFLLRAHDPKYRDTSRMEIDARLCGVLVVPQKEDLPP